MAKKIGSAKSSKRKVASAPEAKAATESKNRKPVMKQEADSAPIATAKNAPPAKPATPSRSVAAQGSLPAEAALSFLRDTKGVVSWSLRDLSQTLNISREEAERVVALMQIQGYVQPEAHKGGEWITTPSGETVSGAKQPRFDRATVEASIASLKERIEETNRDRAAQFEVTRAVAFGDFLAKDRARVQAADVGIELVRKNRERAPGEISAPHSAVDAREEQSFLRQIRGRGAVINIKMYADWMRQRTHQKLF